MKSDFSYDKPLVITEGKTDWKHLKKALEKLQADGFYKHLNIEFKEYQNIGSGEAVLDQSARAHATSQNNRILIHIFDRDTPKYVEKYGKNDFVKILDKSYENSIKQKLKEHYGCDTSPTYKKIEKEIDNRDFQKIDKEMRQVLTGKDYNEWNEQINNEVYALCIPVIKNSDSLRKLDNICIEFYYKEEDLKKKDKQGRRLFFVDEFNFIGNKLSDCDSRFVSKCGNFKTSSINSNEKRLGIVSSDVYHISDKECSKSVLLSKESFAKQIMYDAENFKNFDRENFRLIFDIIKKIIHKNNNIKKQKKYNHDATKKLLVINTSCAVGKTSLTAGIFRPAYPNTFILQVYGINHFLRVANSEAMHEGKMYKIVENIMEKDHIIVDMGGLSTYKFFDYFKTYEGLVNIFDRFIIPTVPGDYTHGKTIYTIIELIKLGVSPSKIRIIFNIGESHYKHGSVEDVFSRTIEVLKKYKIPLDYLSMIPYAEDYFKNMYHLIDPEYHKLDFSFDLGYCLLPDGTNGEPIHKMMRKGLERHFDNINKYISMDFPQSHDEQKIKFDKSDLIFFTGKRLSI